MAASTVGFMAYMTEDQFPEPGGKLFYEATDVNYGEHYNGETGTLTCPVKGLYFFRYVINLTQSKFKYFM